MLAIDLEAPNRGNETARVYFEPVHAIGEQTFQAPGPVTARMAHAYWALVEREARLR